MSTFAATKRSNATHASTTDPEARLYRKGPGMEARLALMGHTLIEDRSGLLVDRLESHSCRRARRAHRGPFHDRAMLSDRPHAQSRSPRRQRLRCGAISSTNSGR